MYIDREENEGVEMSRSERDRMNVSSGRSRSGIQSAAATLAWEIRPQSPGLPVLAVDA